MRNWWYVLAVFGIMVGCLVYEGRKVVREARKERECSANKNK